MSKMKFKIGKFSKLCLVTVDYNRNHCFDDIDLEYCEVVAERREDSDILKFKEMPVVETAVCVNHYGGYDSFDGAMAEAFKYIEEHSLTVCGEPRFCYIHGVWDCERVENWQTEVQIPVRK